MLRNFQCARRAVLGTLALLCPALLPVQAAPTVPTQKAETNAAPSVLLFPFANNAGDTAEGVAGRVTDALRLRLSSVGSYKVTTYSAFLPPVQRAVLETPPVLSGDDIKGPFDPQKAGRVAAQVASTNYLTGAVETYTADQNTRRVSITVSADLRNTQSGNSLRTVAFTGTAAPTSRSESLDSVSQRAVDVVAGRITAALDSGRPAQAVMLNTSRGKSSAGQTFLFAVLASSLIYAVLHNGNGDSHNGGDTSIVTGPASGGTTGSTGSSGGIGGPPAPPTNP